MHNIKHFISNWKFLTSISAFFGFIFVVTVGAYQISGIPQASEVKNLESSSQEKAGQEVIRQSLNRQFIDLEKNKFGIGRKDTIQNNFKQNQSAPNPQPTNTKPTSQPTNNSGLGLQGDVDVEKFFSSARVQDLQFSNALNIDPDTVALYETMALFFGNLDPSTTALPSEVTSDILEEMTIRALTDAGVDAETLNTAMIKLLNEVIKAILENPELINIIPRIENLLAYNLHIFGGVEEQLTGVITQELRVLFSSVLTRALGTLSREELSEFIKLGDLYPSILTGSGLGLELFATNPPMDIQDLLEWTFGADNNPLFGGKIDGIGDINQQVLSNLSTSQMIQAINFEGLLRVQMTMLGTINPGLITSCGAKHALNWPFTPKWQAGIFTCAMCERRCRLFPYRGFFLVPNVQYSYLWDAGSSRCGCG